MSLIAQNEENPCLQMFLFMNQAKTGMFLNSNTCVEYFQLFSDDGICLLQEGILTWFSPLKACHYNDSVEN